MIRDHRWLAVVSLLTALAAPAAGQAVVLVERAPDPHGTPRPARDAVHVPLGTSLYFELAVPPKNAGDEVKPDAVTVTLQRQGGAPVTLLAPGSHFSPRVSGWLKPKGDLQGARALAVYLEPAASLEPDSTYTVVVRAGSERAHGTLVDAGSWRFTTEAAAATHPVAFAVDLNAAPVQWHGQFFSGLCNVFFCTQAKSYGPTYELMAEARRQHPHAWSYQRDFWMTGTEFRPPGLLPLGLPNLVRERETRRIAAIEPHTAGLALHVEDVFGNDQYGIPAGRPLAGDYHAGDEVLVADGVSDARTRVVAVDEAAHTVTVKPIVAPAGGWKIAYEGPLPTRENPDAPGLFPPGGCYLSKFRPHGTPCYYWGRLDKEWDLAVKHYGRRVMANFADATGELTRDGRSWTTAKDLAEWHDVVRTITGHLIDRYGDLARTFTWSVFNEPDLGALFWRADWNDLQDFYDYTTDAILRAFEDHGYDSARVPVGGLELGGIFGVHLRLREFLAHCSPTATAPGATPRNAAVADPRLAGRRSRRVEALSRGHGGKGTPCDFISIHAYSRSELMADKLAAAKREALAIDPAFYKGLWVDSHESCPDWMPPPDTAAADSYLGNGYFPTWAVDVVRRQLAQAAADPRYAFGETILTVWPPPDNFTGLNAITRLLHVDDNADGRGDRTITVPMPIFHVVNLLSDMGDHYWVLPGQVLGGHTVSGFASRAGETVRVLLYAHHPRDTQARSGATFHVSLDLAGLAGAGPWKVTEYRFDRDHNSPFRVARALRDRPAPRQTAMLAPERRAALVKELGSHDAAVRAAALEATAKLGRADLEAMAPALFTLASSADPPVPEALRSLAASVFAPVAYTPEAVESVRAQTVCRPTSTSTHPRASDGHLQLTAPVAGNGCAFLILEPAGR